MLYQLLKKAVNTLRLHTTFSVTLLMDKLFMFPECPCPSFDEVLHVSLIYCTCNGWELRKEMFGDFTAEITFMETKWIKASKMNFQFLVRHYSRPDKR